jgi:AcrR family transcriptional regulator
MTDPVERGLPSGIALAWGIAELPQRGPKRELSVEKIVEAAIAIADADGLGALSMSKVAGSLGYTTMSLYRYVTSKDDLLLLMQDEVSALAIPGPWDDEDWRAGLRLWVTQSLQVYSDHPWYSEVPISGAPMTPNVLLLVDWALHVMRGLPLSDQEKMSTVLLLSGYARNVGTVTRDINQAVKAGSAPSIIYGTAYSEVLRELVTEERFPDLFPVVASGVYTDDEEDDFAFGLERLLDGVERYVEGRESGTAPDTEAESPETYPRDRAVREAMKVRREAASALREAVKREAELVAKAREREARARG